MDWREAASASVLLWAMGVEETIRAGRRRMQNPAAKFDREQCPATKLNQCAITGPGAGAVGGLPGGGWRLRYRWRRVPDARTKNTRPSSRMKRKTPIPNQAEVPREAVLSSVFTPAFGAVSSELPTRGFGAAEPGVDRVAIATIPIYGMRFTALRTRRRNSLQRTFRGSPNSSRVT